MAHVILGLLMLSPHSLYDLTKSFAAGISLFYSASTGSIKRALDRLLAEGRIEVAEQTGGRGRKVYSVTASGREEFRQWMLAEIGGDIDTAVLPRVFFLGLLEPEERTDVAARIRTRIAADLAELEAYERTLGEHAVPEGFEDVARYQLATLRYGVAAHRTGLEWATANLP